MSLQIKKRASLPNNCILNAPEEIILVTTNCEGAAGRGVALAMRERYRQVYNGYRTLCKNGTYTPNSLLYAHVNNGKRLLLFPTKIKWSEPSPPQLIIDNLDKLADLYKEFGFESIAIPPLGMANGRLSGHERERVWLHMQKTFSDFDIPCTIYVDE